MEANTTMRQNHELYRNYEMEGQIHILYCNGDYISFAENYPNLVLTERGLEDREYNEDGYDDSGYDRFDKDRDGIARFDENGFDRDGYNKFNEDINGNNRFDEDDFEDVAGEEFYDPYRLNKSNEDFLEMIKKYWIKKTLTAPAA